MSAVRVVVKVHGRWAMGDGRWTTIDGLWWLQRGLAYSRQREADVNRRSESSASTRASHSPYRSVTPTSLSKALGNGCG